MEKKNLWDIAKRPAVRWTVLLLGCVGILLIGASEWFAPREGESAVTADDYEVRLTRELETLLGRISGVGRCRVMITLENGEEYRYAENTEENRSVSQTEGEAPERSESESYRHTVVLADGAGLPVTQIRPTVRGVAVICQGGGEKAVQEAVTEAVTTVLDISARRVCVIPSS